MAKYTVMDEKMVFDLTAYILFKRRKGEVLRNAPDEFNTWTTKNNIRIDNYQTALWCIDYIRDLEKLPMRELELAYEVDERRINNKKNGIK